MDFINKEKSIDMADFFVKLTKLGKVLEKYSPSLVVAYLFGSSIKGKVKPLSDIDIALLFLTEDINQYIEAKILIDTMEILETEKIDLINLNEAPLHIQYGVLKNKRIIFCDNDVKRIDFETKTIKEYLDFKHIRDTFNQKFLEKIGVGGERYG